MSEMLGNQYFLARRYRDACSQFEIEAKNNPTNVFIKKKLVICFLQTNQFDRAFNTFYEIINEDIKIITSTDPKRDDCPCPEIIDQILPELTFNSSDEQFIKLGILWLYCDIEISSQYFQKVSSTHSLYPKIQRIIDIEKSQLTIIN